MRAARRHARAAGRTGAQPGRPAPPSPAPPRLVTEAHIAEQEIASLAEGSAELGAPSPISCPNCGGVLNRLKEGKNTRFRCQIGHAFGAQSLAAAQADTLELALATAMRTHRERQVLFRQMEEQALAQGMRHTARRWARSRAEAEQAAALIAEAAETLRRAQSGEAEAAD